MFFLLTQSRLWTKKTNSVNTSSVSSRGPPCPPLISPSASKHTPVCKNKVYVCVCVCLCAHAPLCCLQVAGRQPIRQQIRGEPQAPHFRTGRARHLLYASAINTHHRYICSHCFVFVFFFTYFLSPLYGGVRSAPLSGLDAVAGQLQECEALSQVSTSVSILPASISRQLRSFYTHQLRRRSPSA